MLAGGGTSMRRCAAARLAPLGGLGSRWATTAVAVHRSPQAPQYPRKIADYPNVIAHLGVGGFHRSHQAMYLHELLEAKGKDAGWALCGVGLMPGDADMQEKLAAQEYMYTVLSQGNSGMSATVVGSIMDFILVPADPFAAVERLAAPEVRLARAAGHCTTFRPICLHRRGERALARYSGVLDGWLIHSPYPPTLHQCTTTHHPLLLWGEVPTAPPCRGQRCLSASAADFAVIACPETKLHPA
jgi:hypothetical protein